MTETPRASMGLPSWTFLLTELHTPVSRIGSPIRKQPLQLISLRKEYISANTNDSNWFRTLQYTDSSAHRLPEELAHNSSSI
jgi:hypothetical protein